MGNILIYLIFIFVASFFAQLAQKFDKKENEHRITGKNGLIFWGLSILTMIVFLGLRRYGLGVDDYNYKSMFEEIGKNGFIAFFLKTNIEPGYLILNQIFNLITKDYQVVIFITSIPAILLFYKAFEYEKKNINLFLCIFLFGTLMSVYFIGINRLFIATAIVAYSLRFIFQKKPIKYIICILIAITIHYSSGIMLLFAFLAFGKNKFKLTKKNTIIIFAITTLVIIPICTIIVSEFVFPMMSSRYSGYRISFKGLSIMDFDKIPFLIMFIIWYKMLLDKKLKPKNEKEEFDENDNTFIYLILYSMMIIIGIYSKFIDIGRIQWYFAFPGCILFSRVFKTLNGSKFFKLSIVYLVLMVLYGGLFTNSIINSSSRVKKMNNYSNVLFLWEEK